MKCVFNPIDDRFHIVDRNGMYSMGQGLTEQDAWESYRNLHKTCEELLNKNKGKC